MVGAAWLSAEETEKKPAAKKQEVDITKKFREHNSDKYLRPPTKFNKGHVTPRKLDQGAFRRYKGGFTEAIKPLSHIGADGSNAKPSSPT